MDKFDDNIAIVRRIGAGAYFDAYEAFDTSIERRVFLKVARVSDDPSVAAVAEAHFRHWRALARENLEGMPAIFDIGEKGASRFLITEWINGAPLRAVCQAPSGVIGDPARFLKLLLERCLIVLENLHGRGFLHGDISPGNILVDPEIRHPIAYLIDPVPPLTLVHPDDPSRGLVLGTPPFAAPEILAGEPKTPQSDLFSLGRVIAEAGQRLGTAPPDLVAQLIGASAKDRPASAAEALAFLRADRRISAPVSTPGSARPAGHPGATGPRDGMLGRIGRMLRRKFSVPVPEPTGAAPLPDRAPDLARTMSLGIPVSLPASAYMTGPVTVSLPPPASPAQTTGAVTVPLAAPGPAQTALPLAPGSWAAVSAQMTIPMPPLAPQNSPAQADFLVVAPGSVQPGRHFVVEVWVAPSGEHDAMLDQATRNGRMIERGGRSHINLYAHAVITVILKLPDFEVPESIELLGWNADIRNVGFIVKAPASLEPGIYPGSAKLMLGDIPFASVLFDLEVVPAEGEIERLRKPVDGRIQRIARAFASYASLDRGEVLRRVQGIQAAGIKVFLDIINLRRGQEWESVLLREIEASDSFFLFWSRNAARSEWVGREWRYALQRRGLEFINPLPLEDPRLAEPPAELRSKHFNDMLLAFIKAEEEFQIGRRRRPPG